ncbi:flagellar hook protein [Desulfovibrio sp.]|uniref:flagellin N-terminal helical domain-containing protein n=1 Tax=Desulfovibrio sp. TaxID=885 RepID=UPI0023D759D3|nr:flagellar hook protein [Desulfovibrio sp.]MDE7241447.1 flagellar hook protein [Desulfovibrio sp.]
MAIRVTQKTMYNDMVGQMQKNLAGYMESVQQGSTQKKINRPSDDPAGTYRVLTTRIDLTNTAQYQENVDTAKGWLNLEDSVLSTRVPTVIQDLITLAEQASTGTYDASQRKIMADQARQQFGSLLELANTDFEGKSIFAGHRYDKNAFEEGLALTSWDEDWDKAIREGDQDGKPVYKLEGASAETVIVQFTEDGTLGDETEFRWSNDGGDHWHTEKAKLDADGNVQLAANGVILTVSKDMPVKAAQTVDANGEEVGPGARNGTMLYIRPAAIYQGDDKDPPLDITLMGAPKGLEVEAKGDFGKNLLVRMDEKVDLNTTGQTFKWSYSTDGGSNWVTVTGQTNGDTSLRLPVPGGYVDFDAGGMNGATLTEGMQVMVHPSRADLKFEIMKDTFLSVNAVGKDIFGGYYEGMPALDGDNNLFEVVGAFIGYLEGNNQEGAQRTLAALKVAEKQILSAATAIGGKENRIQTASDVLSFQKLDQQERLSYTEDIDLTELLTKLTRQQLTYQTVLQSSSMIMKLSLANYV